MSDDGTQTQSQGVIRRRTAPIWTLRVLYTNWTVHPRWSVVLPAGETTVGRRAKQPQDIALSNDPLLSRAHVRFIRQGSSLTVVDLESRNGTQLNGKLLVKPASVSDGDVVRVGDSFLMARLEPVDVVDVPLAGLQGTSPVMRKLRGLLSAVGGTDASVVLQGESGSGKGVCARIIHTLSGRAGRFVQVNCAAVPEQLAESAFFGHTAGAFTGARGSAEGYFRAADGGTLFVDEVGELSSTLQPKLLHALDAGEITPVGATRATACDVRVVAATNRDLVSAVREGTFRGDLFARLAGMMILVPPLRERKEDLLPLLVGMLGAESPPLSPDLVALLLGYRWPFNVREVERVATELKVRSAGHTALEASMIAERLEAFAEPAPTPAPAAAPAPAAPPPEEAPVADARRSGPPEQAELEALLRAHHGVIASVAREVGRSTKQVYRWMSRYGLDPEAYRD